MSDPLVSVVIGAYNCSGYIQGALECVFCQTYPEIEVIVVDDASTDNTRDVLRQYGDRITVIERKVNSATCELPRYQGAKAARGKYCAFLDADDRWMPDKLKKQVTALEMHPDQVLCHTYAEIIDEKGSVTGIRHEGQLPQTGNCARDLLHHCFITISSVLVRRQAWLDALSEEAIQYFGMDWDFFLTLARSRDFCLIDEPLTQYRKAAGAVSFRKWRRRPRNVFSMERIRKKRLWETVATKEEYDQILLDAYIEDAEYYCYSCSPWRALYFCALGSKYNPVSLSLMKYALKSFCRMLSFVRTSNTKKR